MGGDDDGVCAEPVCRCGSRGMGRKRMRDDEGCADNEAASAAGGAPATDATVGAASAASVVIDLTNDD